MERLIRRAAETMLSLGIANQEAIQPFLDAWINRPPDEGTQDEDTELAMFLSQLFKARVINRDQGRTLLSMLTEGPAPPADDPYMGRRFGSYVAEELVGEGAMGKVYRATREGTLERNYVIKVFTSSSDEAGMKRFRREGDVMSKLDHPNIIKVVGSGQEGAVAFLVLEYCDGPNLAELLAERQRFSWKSATRAIKQITSALAAAHDQGIIHRDIKPQNVMVAPGGLLKLFDFGLAKTLDSKASTLSQAGEIIGSPAFMAPEQWGDHQVDERADLFAVGVIYYMLIAGEIPFKGRTPADFSIAIREGTYAPLVQAVPEVPLGVCQIIDQLLEKDRAWRTPSAHRLLEDLDRVLRGKGPNVPRIEVVDSAQNKIVQRFPLVGGDSFTAGVDFEAQVFIDGPGVENEHAEVQRTDSDYVLKALAGETRVNGKLVLEIVLRDKDLIVFGQGPTLRYRSGNLGRRSTSRAYTSASERLKNVDEVPAAIQGPGPPIQLSGLVCDALRSVAHPRTLLMCFEALDPYTAEVQLEETRLRLFRAGLPKEIIEPAIERAQKVVDEEAWKIADALFTSTKENLGSTPEAWLAWWFEVRGRMPQQVLPPVQRATASLHVVPEPGAEELTFDLADGEDWVVGRHADCDITIPEKSVSRQHLTLHRLGRRFAYVDLGSRYGTTIKGKRVTVGFLAENDEFKLGRAVARFHDKLLGRADEHTGGAIQVDGRVFRALIQLRSPAVVWTLVRLLDAAPLLGFCLQTLAPLEPSDKVTAALQEFLGGQADLARAALPVITGVASVGTAPEAWKAWWAQNGQGLGVQVEPRGWGG